MFQSYANTFKYSLRVKHDISKVINNFTSEDMENMPPESWMLFCVNFTSDVYSGKTFVSIIIISIIHQIFLLVRG